MDNADVQSKTSIPRLLGSACQPLWHRNGWIPVLSSQFERVGADVFRLNIEAEPAMFVAARDLGGSPPDFAHFRLESGIRFVSAYSIGRAQKEVVCSDSVDEALQENGTNAIDTRDLFDLLKNLIRKKESTIFLAQSQRLRFILNIKGQPVTLIDALRFAAGGTVRDINAYSAFSNLLEFLSRNEKISEEDRRSALARVKEWLKISSS